MSEGSNFDESKISVPLQDTDLTTDIIYGSHFPQPLSEESKSETSVDTCASNLVESISISLDVGQITCEHPNSVYRYGYYANSTLSSNSGIVESIQSSNYTTISQVSFQAPPSLSVNVSGYGVDNAMLQKSEGEGNYLINDSVCLAHRELGHVSNEQCELVMATYSTQSTPKHYTIVGIGQTFPTMPNVKPVLSELPKLGRAVTYIGSHQQTLQEKPIKTGFGIETVSEEISSPIVQKPQCMISSQQHQQQTPLPEEKNDFRIVGNPTIPPFMYDSVQWNLGRLPNAEKEAISVASIIRTIPVLREQATKQSILYSLRSAKVIHLATHGSASAWFLAFTSSFPLSKSGLAEKEHILIFPKEIETLNISPALVVLSSCDSARGQVKAERVIGMARAFLSAGAHSVLASLWRVPDESANIFMQFFYQFLVNGLLKPNRGPSAQSVSAPRESSISIEASLILITNRKLHQGMIRFGEKNMQCIKLFNELSFSPFKNNLQSFCKIYETVDGSGVVNIITTQDSFQCYLTVEPSKSLSANVLRHSTFHIGPAMLCIDASVSKMLSQGITVPQIRENISTVRGFNGESDSSSEGENSDEDKRVPNKQHLLLMAAPHTQGIPPYPDTSTTIKSNFGKKTAIPNTLQQQQVPLSQNMDFSDPVSVINKAAVFLTAGDYGMMLKVLKVLDKHLVLPEDIDMAKEFGQGLANYKNLHYRAAKPCFNALFEKSVNYHSSGNQALASIYLSEIEMSWAKYKDAEKHFTSAVTYYSPDNVAEKFQHTILTKSAVLVKKGQCHRSLLQIREAINAFKMAKEVAELAQEQARGSKLKIAKEDELSALSALGNILQSIGDYEQSFEYYEKSFKLAGELGDHVSVGWAHGNLGNAMLGLDQKDKALDHLMTAFHMSARYEHNPLAVGRAVSNLGNAYQAIGNLPNAIECYEIALGHTIYGNDLQGQGRACDNIGNVYMLLKEPVKAVHYYTETLCLSTDKNTKITGYHNRGCARFDVAECIIQGKKPKELVTATTPDPVYDRLTIKLTDEVITTDPVQEAKPNRGPSVQNVNQKNKVSIASEMLPTRIIQKTYDGETNVEIVRLVEALPFLEAAKSDLLEAIESHELSFQNVKGSHDAFSLSLSLFESNSRSFYKIQETLVELGKLRQRLSELGVTDMTAAEPQEFKDALVYGEQARARTLGELVLQKKKTIYSDLFSISTPLKIQDIYKTVELQKVPVIFLSYCVSKLLMWILVSVKDEIVMKCQSIELKDEDLENGSFELYIRYNLLQFLSKDEINIFRRCAYEQESPFTVLHDVIAIKIIEGLKSVGCSEVTEFIVIPDSVTHLLPFSPLMNKHNWQLFGDKYRIKIVPSFLSLLVMSMISNPVVEIPGDKSDFLIVGNPTVPPFMYDSVQWNLGRLPHAEKEAISVASIIGTTPVLREQATKQSILYRLRSAKVIHLATHGSPSAGFLVFTSSFPLSKSGLAEKEHILIFPREIETLNISPALVVLSSCGSARGQVKAEGVIGMARAFLSAGAHSVLVSLWRVPDESANIFMQFFYQFLVNGLPSLQALQRSMQCLRCFLKYSHYLHWSGFQIIGKEITFHKNSYTQFPIERMLGEVSIFPRQQVKNIEESLLGVKSKVFRDVQLLVGTPGNEPEECARDFIKNCYYYYPCGVYWYDASNELLLETCVKVAHETPLMGGTYKEQKELDPLPTNSNPLLLTTKASKPTNRKEKKLIILNNFTSLKTCYYIMREMKDASTDIIVVSNKLFCKEEIAKDFDKHLSRGCNIIEVTSLQPISIMQRIVYALLEKNSFVARDADHIVFTLLGEYSRGAATIVHMLTSLMQKSVDNSRTGFELAKKQVKLHKAHLKLEQSLNGYTTPREANSTVNEKKYHDENVTTAMEPQIARTNLNHDSSSQGNSSGNPMFTNESFTLPHDNQKEIQTTSSEGKRLDATSSAANTTSGFVSMGIQNESFIMPNIDEEVSHRDNDPHGDDSDDGDDDQGEKREKANDDVLVIQPEGHNVTSSTGKHPSIHEVKDLECTQVRTKSVSGRASFVAGSNSKPTDSSDASPTTAKPSKEDYTVAHSHPVYMYISDIISTNISSLAHHLLNSLIITGHIPLPSFYVEELNNVVMNAGVSKGKKNMQTESPMKELVKVGAVRSSSYPIIYHKNLHPDYIDTTIQPMFIPKLIYEAVNEQMDYADKALSILSVQRALERLLTNETKPNSIHLHYILILCNQLDDVCSRVSDHLLTTNLKLKLQILQILRP